MARSTTAGPRELTDFEQIVLGFIGVEPRSGYDLKRLFRTTAAAVYQPSDGALYPALRRLEQRGLLDAETVTSRRRRRVYRVTPEGRATTVRWVSRPIDPSSVGRDLGLHMVRFVLMEGIQSRTAVEAFLAALVAALEGFVSSLEQYADSAKLPGRHPHLALGHGIGVHRASLDWARSALVAVARDSAPDDSLSTVA